MPAFSKASLQKLQTCDARLQRVFLEVVKRFDCTVIAGHRGQAEQDAAFAAGASKLIWPNSKHNAQPSRAADVVPYPIDWGNVGTDKQRRAAVARFYLFIGYVIATGRALGVELRSGADWDGDTDLNDQQFNDLPHFELVDQ